MHGPVLGVGPDSGMGYGGFRGGDDGPGPFIYREACVLALGLLAAEAGGNEGFKSEYLMQRDGG